MLVYSLILSLMLSFLIAFIGLILSQKFYFDTEKLSPFECGFSGKLTHRSLFSVQFFLICLIFVIFDVELVVLFPILSGLPETVSLMETILFFFVVVLLTVGLLWEWSAGMLEWIM